MRPAVQRQDIGVPQAIYQPETATGATAARLYKRVTRHILEMLDDQKFGIGDRIPPERELAIALGVSRPVLREALLALEVLGFVDVRIGSGCYVRRLPTALDRKFTEVSLLHVLEALLMIEGGCLHMACDNVSERRLTAIEEAMDSLRREQAEPGWMKALLTFHVTIMSWLENPAVEQAVHKLWHMACHSEFFARDTYRESGRRNRAIARHEQILEAITARNSALGSEKSRQFLTELLHDQMARQEEREIEKARLAVREKHARFLRAMPPEPQDGPHA